MSPADEVLVDGVDVRDIDPDVLWSRVGLVPQKPYLFSGTIASNLRYGRPDATDEQIWQALDTAQASDFVEEMDSTDRCADRPGRHQRLRRPAPAAVDCTRPGQASRDLRLRRRVQRAGCRHRCATARSPGGPDQGRGRADRRAAGLHGASGRSDHRLGRRHHRGRGHPHRTVGQLPDLPRDRGIQLSIEEAA